MDHLSQRYQITDICLLSALSTFSVCLFVFLKFKATWSRENYLKGIMIIWAVLEMASLIMFSLIIFGKLRFAWFPEKSVHNLLGIVSLWGIAMIQVSQSLSLVLLLL